MSAAPPDAESLLQNIPRDRPLAIIVAGHNGSGKSTLWNQRLSQALLIPLLQLLQRKRVVWAVLMGGVPELSVHINYVDTYLGVIVLAGERYVPWQQFVDLADVVVGDAFEHVVEIELGIEAVGSG